MKEHKIIILGPMGAGKTTAIESIVEGTMVSTDVRNTEANPNKATTTVALDYGDVQLPNGDRLRIFGTPGQERFDFIWSSLAKGAVGAIILADATLDAIEDHLPMYLNVVKNQELDLPTVIGLSKTDLIDEQQLQAIKIALAAQQYHLPVIACDCRDKDDVMTLMDALMCEVEMQELLSQLS